MDYLEYKGYKGSVEYSKEDDCLVGKVLGLTKETILYEGSTLEELKSDFEAGIDSYLAYCESEGIKPSKGYSVAFNVRVSPEMHRRIAMNAAKYGLSLNSYVRQCLERAVMS